MPSKASARVDALEKALRAAGTPERAAREKRYLKSLLEHLGTSVPVIRRAALGFARAHPGLEHDELVALTEALWARGIHECRMAAVELLAHCTPLIGSADARLLERLLHEAQTWAIVDGLAAHVVGPVAERVEAFGAVLDRWARDESFWVRRAALLALLVPLREGRGDFVRFGRYADALLGDREFFVRKAIGWVLRDASRRTPQRVAAWLLPRAARASSLTVREAVKYLPAKSRIEILRAAGLASRSGRASRRRAAPPSR